MSRLHGKRHEHPPKREPAGTTGNHAQTRTTFYVSSKVQAKKPGMRFRVRRTNFIAGYSVDCPLPWLRRTTQIVYVAGAQGPCNMPAFVNDGQGLRIPSNDMCSWKECNRHICLRLRSRHEHLQSCWTPSRVAESAMLRLLFTEKQTLPVL